MSDATESFERKVVFRVTRGYFFVMAVLASLAVCVGVGAVVLGVARPPPFEPSPPPAVPAPPPMNLASVDKFLAGKQQVVPEYENFEDGASPEAEQRNPGPAREELSAQAREELRVRAETAQLMAKLRESFPAPEYAWADEYETYCKVPSEYGCMQRAQKLSKPGVEKALQQLLKGERSPSEALALLQVLVSVLAEAPVGRRGSLIEPVVTAYRANNADYIAKLRARERQIASAMAEHKINVVAQQASKALFRTYGFYAALGGLGVLILVGLFLAHLAIERHLRLLERVVATIQPREQTPP